MAQVYASYKYRRDLVEATKAFGMLGRSKALTYSQAIAKVLLLRHHISTACILLMIISS